MARQITILTEFSSNREGGEVVNHFRVCGKEGMTRGNSGGDETHFRFWTMLTTYPDNLTIECFSIELVFTRSLIWVANIPWMKWIPSDRMTLYKIGKKGGGGKSRVRRHRPILSADYTSAEPFDQTTGPISPQPEGLSRKLQDLRLTPHAATTTSTALKSKREQGRHTHRYLSALLPLATNLMLNTCRTG